MSKTETPEAGVGHNSGADKRLKSIVERIERLEEEKKGLSADVRDIYSEAKGAGFDPKIIRQLIRRRKMDPDARAEQDALLETYEGVFA